VLSGGIVTSARLASPSSVRPEGGSPQGTSGDFPTPLRMHKNVAPLSKMMFGINRYKVIKAALKAMHVIPGVPAIGGKRRRLAVRREKLSARDDMAGRADASRDLGSPA